MKLYEITEGYLQLLELENIDLTEYLESIQDQANEKLIYLGRLIKQIDAESAAIKAEEKKLADRRKSLENKSASLESYMLTNMVKMEMTECKDATIVIKTKFNPASLIVDDETLIPDNLKVLVPESLIIDKNLLKELIKNGTEVQGCHLERKQSISIK